MEAQPEFAFQVYSTIPLDSDHEALCQYLAQEIDFRPGPAFEIYAPQPDAFACVEHQRREIAHRKRIRPGEDFFPGIAKVEPNEFDRLPKGFLLVITSDVYRAGFQAHDHYEKGTGPLLVTFNRSFPDKTVVDVRSRCTTAPPYWEDVDYEPNPCPERNGITVQKCQDIWEMKWGLKWTFRRSIQRDFHYDYGLLDDEGEPFPVDQGIPHEDCQLLNSKADSLALGNFTVASQPDGAVTITTAPMASEPDLRYIIHVAFPLSDLHLAQVAKAFTSTLMEKISGSKSVCLVFHSSYVSFSHIAAKHRALLESRPEITIGGIQDVLLTVDEPPKKMRIFPQTRSPSHGYGYTSEPYCTFAVILDRPNFLTAPGVLFLFANRSELQEDHNPASAPDSTDDEELSNILEYQVWRSAGMSEVAQRLAFPS